MPERRATLLMAERHGVPIDYCPECRGVWLERGRLDQLLDTDDSDGHRSADGHRGSDRHNEKHQGEGRRRKGVSGLLGDFLGGGH